jgi:ADP-heptose:LPS heptosyltransferase
VRFLPAALARAIEDGGRELTVLALRLAAMGDVLRALPPVRLLRRALPHAHLRWIVDDRWSRVLAGHPDLDGLVVVPRRSLRENARSPASWGRLPKTLEGLYADLRSPRADLLVDFHGNLRSGWIGTMSGAPVRLGHAGHQQKEANRWFTTHRVDAGPRRVSRIERNLDLVRALGIAADGPLPDCGLTLPVDGASVVERVRSEIGDRWAVISPGASARQAHKKPPPGALAAAIEPLVSAGVTPVVQWGPGEEEDAARVVRESGGRAVLAPPTDLAELAALLAAARSFVGGDSGPLHLACAVGCPVVGVYGPTDPVVNAPWGVPHRVVAPRGRDYTGIKRIDRRRGFDGLDRNDVADAVRSLLREISRLEAGGSA